MRTRLLTFSPNMTLINEAMRFHHFPQPGPAAPARSWYQRCSPFVFIRQSLDLPPNIPVTSEPLGGWHYPTMEPPRALHVFISSLCFIFRKAGRRPWWAWKRVQTIALEAKGHPMLFVIKGKPRQEAGPGGLLLPAGRQDPVGRRQGRPLSVRHPLSHKKTITYSNEGQAPALSQMWKCFSISSSITVSSELEQERRTFLPSPNERVSSHSSFLHSSPIIFYFNGILGEELIWLFRNGENEYRCNIKLLFQHKATDMTHKTLPAGNQVLRPGSQGEH